MAEYNNSDNNSVVSGSSGADTIYNSDDTVTVNALGGGDEIENTGTTVSISGGDGNDTITNYGTDVTIDGGAGTDDITNGSSDVSINGGAANDTITNDGSDVTINGGAGNDSIINNSNYEVLFQYDSGGGNDSIVGFNENSTLQISSGTGSVISDGTDIFVAVGSNTITLEETFGLTDFNIVDSSGKKLEGIEIKITADGNPINNSYENATITGSSSGDDITNYADKVTINGNAGSDTITNSGASVIIDGGAGDDTISNDGENTSITGGAGADEIENNSDNVTINGGAGENAISNSGQNVLFQYGSGGGADYISGFNDTSTLQISLNDSSIKNITSDAVDLFVAVGSNTITLGGAFGLDTINIVNSVRSAISFNFTGTDGADSVDNYFANVSILGGSGKDTINNYGASVTIDGGASVDSIYNEGLEAQINGGAGNDTITNSGSNVTINGGAGNDSIINTGSEIVFQYSAGEGNDSIQGFDSNTTLQLLSGSITSATTDGANLSFVIGSNTLTIEDGFNLGAVNIADSEGKEISLSGIELIGTGDADDITNSTENVTISGLGGDDTISNSAENVSINGGAGADEISNNIANVTINGGAGNDTIANSGASVLFQYTSGEGNDYISGFDSTSTLKILSGSVNSLISDGSNIFVAVGSNNTLTLESAFGLETLNIINSSDNQVELNFLGTKDADSFTNSFSNATISGLGGDDYINNTAENVSINGGDGADEISNDGSNVTISGGASSDNITNYADKVTISGDAGDDTIANSSGSNVLINYTSGDGNDLIQGLDANSTFQVLGDSIKNVTSDGTNLFLSIGSNVVTLENAFDLERLNVFNPDGTAPSFNFVGTSEDESVDNYFDNVSILGDAGNDTITNNGLNVTIDGGAGADVISNETTNIEITGGAGSDSITNNGEGVKIDGDADNDYIENYGESVVIDGGAGEDTISNSGENVTINSGAGNDTITNYSENVLFQYSSGDGNDLIQGFNENTTLQITSGNVDSIISDGTNISLAVGSNIVTLEESAGFELLNVINSSGSQIDLNISGTANADSFNNRFSNATISALGGDDYISNGGSNVIIDGGTGTDEIINEGIFVTVNGGANDDTITNNSASALINGDAGNDDITNNSDNVTINGGAGNDTITNNSSENVLFQYSAGEGNDSIVGFNDSSTLQILSGSIKSVTSDATDIFVAVGDNTITLDGGFALTSLNFADKDGNALSLSGIEIVGTEEADTFTNNFNNATINGNGGGDDITNYGANVIVNVGEIDNVINNYGASVIINGGASADNITNEGANVTINGNGGDDLISNNGGSNILINYNSSDGNDAIYGFNENSTLQISGDSVKAVTSDGTSLFLSIGDATITLDNTFDLEVLNVFNPDGNRISFNFVGTSDADTVSNFFNNISVNGGGGSDAIENYGVNVTIDGGADNDEISNSSNSAVINGGAGDDTIFNSNGENVLFQYSAGGGSDLIQGFNETSTLQITSGTVKNITSDNSNIFVAVGEDTVTLENAFNLATINIVNSVGSAVSFNFTGTDEADSLDNFFTGISIDGGAGDDTLSNKIENVTINGGAGNDSIYNENATITIDGGAGNDTITNSGANVLFLYSGGNDLIQGFTDSSTLKVSAGDIDSITSNGVDILVTVGEDTLTLESAFEQLGTQINILKQDGTAVSLDGIEIIGTEEADTFTSNTDKVTIKGLGGDDTIDNGGLSAVIDGGDGADEINNSALYVSINGGKGNDNITNGYEDVTITGGEGNDTISNNANENVLIQYSAGEGSDSIVGFNENSTLQILSGSIKSAASDGANLFLTIGNDTITLDSAFNLNVMNIIQADGTQFPLNISGTEDADTFNNYFSNATISGLGGSDYIYNTGSNVIINSGENDNEIYNEASKVTINGGANNERITNNGASALINGNAGDDEITSSENFATINGGAGNDTIENSGASSYIYGDEDDDAITNNGKNVVIEGGAGDDSITNNNDNATIAGGTGNDTISNNASYEVLFQYRAGDGNDLIQGFNDYSTLQILSGSIKSATSDGTDIFLAIGDSTITLENALGNKLNIVNQNGAGISLGGVEVVGTEDADTFNNPANNVTINTFGGDDTVNNSGSNVIINGGDGADEFINDGTFVTINGGASNDNITNNSGNVLINGDAGDDLITNNSGDFENITINGGAGNDDITNNGAKVLINGDAGNDLITNNDYGENSTIAAGAGNDTINNSAANVLFRYGGGSDLIQGFNDTSTLQIMSGTISKITSDGTDIFVAVGQDTLTLENGFNLNAINLADSAGNSIAFEGMEIVGTEEVDSFTNPFDKVAIIGLSGDDYIYNSGASVTINAGKGNDYISNEGASAFIKYAEGDGNDTIIGFNATSTLQIGDGTGTYSTVKNDNDIIATVGESSITLSDAATLTSLNILGKKVSAGYGWEFNGTSAIYNISDEETLAVLSGVNSSSTLEDYNEGIILSANNFADNVSVISSAARKFELTAGNYSGKTFSGTSQGDTITNAGSNISIAGAGGNDKINNSGGSAVSIAGGTGSDYVTLGGGSNIFVYTSGDGKDILYSFDSTDKIQIIGATEVEDSVKNKDVVFKVGSGTITVKNAATDDGIVITLVGADGGTISENTYTTNGIISGDTIELSANLKRQYAQPSGISVVDGFLVKSSIRITGSSLTGGTLTGGKAKDTLISGTNNFMLTGGKGNDLFVYGGGNDTITDYNQKGQGSDRISVASGLTYSGYSFDGSDVILNYGSGNTLRIVDGKDKKITFAARKLTSNIYNDVGVFDGKMKSVTLAASTNASFRAASYSKLATIDASATGAIRLLGNNKANYITAGNSGSTLIGGKGKDTLVGGSGTDIFVYENKSGNTIINNYGQGDIVSLGSGASISQVTLKRDDVIFKVGTNKITVEDMAKSQFTFVEGGVTKTYDNGNLISGTSVTLQSGYKGAFTLTNTAYQNVSAELGTKAVQLIGNASANSLIGGRGKDSLFGDAGNDTLWGGKGNDTLTGGAGFDTFIYQAGGGTDVITDYTSGDLLQILNKKGNTGDFKHSTFSDGILTLSISGGGKVILTGVSESTSFNINNKTYSISGNSLNK